MSTPIYAVVKDRERDLDKFAGEFTARVPPVPIPNTEVKPRWADGTARASVWEIRSSPAIILLPGAVSIARRKPRRAIGI